MGSRHCIVTEEVSSVVRCFKVTVADLFASAALWSVLNMFSVVGIQGRQPEVGGIYCRPPHELKNNFEFKSGLFVLMLNNKVLFPMMGFKFPMHMQLV